VEAVTGVQTCALPISLADARQHLNHVWLGLLDHAEPPMVDATTLR
jgi:hypothetical protein